MSCNDSSIPPPPPPGGMDLESNYRHQVAQYVIIACLTLCVWDWLLAVSDEIEMFRHGERRLRYLLNGLYLIARIAPIIYLTVHTILAHVPIQTCRLLARFIAASTVLIMPAVCGLFCIRLSAIYSHNKYVMIIFGSSWLGILGIFIFDAITVLLRFSPSTGCFVTEHSDSWGYIATAIYDTLMYLAISWRLAWFAPVDGWKSRTRSFITGGGLSGLSKVLLRSGQMYYFMTIGFSICTTVFLYSPSVPSVWNGLLLEPNITVASIMACRLVRELKLGQFADPMTEGAVSKLVFNDIRNIPQQRSGRASELHTANNADMDTGGLGDRGICDIE